MARAMFKKLTPVRIFEQVVEQIRELIMKGTYRPGDKLPSEQELEKFFDVSRSSIREALRVLEYEGFVEVRRGSGTYISDYTKHRRGRIEIVKWLEKREDTLRDLMQVRESLEGLSASLAAVTVDKAMIASLHAVQDELSDLVRDQSPDSEIDVDELVHLDSKFHVLISEYSGNTLVYELISNVIPAFQDSNKAVIYMGASPEKMRSDHKKILDAIEAGDPEAARLAMKEHIIRVSDEFHNINMSLLADSDPNGTQ